MEQICDKNKCTGCSACFNSCPKNCISMKANKFGVLLPEIDQAECINCGACERSCPVNHIVKKNMPRTAYAAWHLNPTVRKSSASGGAAMVFYQSVIEQGGICFGTCFDEELNLRIQSATTLNEINKFRGSKYVQAYVGKSYREVKEELDLGKLVLYIGTPCQIAGLKNYLKKEYEKLIAVDLICHGVPSLTYLHEHIAEIEKKLHKKVDNVTFRGEYSYELALFQDEQLIYRKHRYKDSYFTGFLNGLFCRPNCYDCPYACEERVSDITIGDFWGLGKEAPCSYGMGDGVSVILVNTDKGQDFLMQVRDKMFLEERPLTEAINGNDQLRHPGEKNDNYELFRELYLRDGFEQAAKKCTHDDMRKWWRENRKNNVKRALRKCKRIFERNFRNKGV